jgi:hypothetical protein
VHHVTLAWELAQAVDERLGAGERRDIYVALGAGDIATAIRGLTRAIVRERVELPSEIMTPLVAWCAAYPGG